MNLPDAQLLPARRRLEFLDALRGLAALYVLVYHMLLVPDPHLAAPKWAELVALAGGTGVTLFFLVSSFSLYYTMPLRLRERSPTFSFYLHRFFRIAPLFYFMIAVTLLRDLLMFDTSHGVGEVLASLLFVFNFIPEGQTGFVWAGWTIGVEMVFYALFPLIYARVRGTGNAVAFFFACLLGWMALQLALAYIVMPDSWLKSILQWSAFRHFPIFAIGIVVYQLFMSIDMEKMHSGHYRGLGNALLLAGLFAFAALLRGWLPNLFGDGYYWQGIVFGLLFLGLALAPWRAVVNRASTFLGKVSYSIYLLHTTAILLLTPLLRWYYANVPTTTLAFLLSLATVLAVVLPLSWLTYRFVEEPGMRLGKRVAGWLRARQQRTLQPRIRWYPRVPELLAGEAGTRARFHQIEDALAATPVREGFCVVCQRLAPMTVFGGAMLGDHINLREGMVCQACGINARSRLLYLAADQRFPGPDARVAVLESFSPLAKAMAKRWPQAQLSEYMEPDSTPGATVERTLADGRRDTARHEDLMRLSYADASLDGIVHNDVLEHVADVAVALRECWRVLRPGGSMVFTMPWFPWAAATRVRGRLRADGSLEKLLPDEYHGDGLRAEGIYTFYNFGADLDEMLAAAGFAQRSYGVCYAPELGFYSNNFRYGDDGLMLPTVLMATKAA